MAILGMTMFCSSVHGRIFAAGFVLAMAFAAESIFAQEGRKLRAGYASLSGNMALYWAAKDAGLFKKNGLDIDRVAFPNGTEGMAAMIADEIEFLAIAGSTSRPLFGFQSRHSAAKRTNTEVRMSRFQ
jgi:ABC-type nitrate/sulfonate/bicarbonate transport system substrate-binding protein